MLVPVFDLVSCIKNEDLCEREKVLKANEEFYEENTKDWSITNPYRAARILDMAINGNVPSESFDDDEIDLWSLFRKILRQNDFADEYFENRTAERNDTIDEIAHRFECRANGFERMAEHDITSDKREFMKGKAAGLRNAITTLKTYKEEVE